MRCHGIQYCSRDCQRADWPAHKRHCEPGKPLEDGVYDAFHAAIEWICTDNRLYGAIELLYRAWQAEPSKVFYIGINSAKNLIYSGECGARRAGAYRRVDHLPARRVVVVVDERCVTALRIPDGLIKMTHDAHPERMLTAEPGVSLAVVEVNVDPMLASFKQHQ